MRFTKPTRLKPTPFELHHGRKPRTELTKLDKDGKSFLSVGPNYLFQLNKKQSSQSTYREMKRKRVM